MFFPVAATSRQILIVKFFVVCCRFFFYHETLSTVALHRIKAFGLRLPDDWFRTSNCTCVDAESLFAANGFLKLNFLGFHWSFRCFFCYIDEKSALLVAPTGYLVEPVIQLSGGHDAQKPFQHVAVIFGASKVPVPSNPQQEDTQDIQFADKNQLVLVAFYEQKLSGLDSLID